MQQQLTNLLKGSPDNILFIWRGRVYDEQDYYVRLDKTYAVLVYLVRDMVMVRRLSGFKQVYTGEPCAVYSCAPAVVITQGGRKGRIIPKAQVQDNDVFEQVNQEIEISEYLKQYSSGKNLFKFLDKAVRVRELVYPEPYLACRKDSMELTVRDRQETVEFLRGFPGYAKDESLDANFRRLLPKIAKPAGEDRAVYPFKHVFGRGVVVFEHGSFGKWFLISEGNAVHDSSFIKLDFRVRAGSTPKASSSGSPYFVRNSIEELVGKAVGESK